MERAADRLEVLRKITEYERNGWFDRDVENDPEGRTIMPGEVDYTRKKLSSKIATKYAYFIARKYLNGLIKDGAIVVKEIKGLENFKNLKSGAVITCNHFNAMDSFAMQILYDRSGHRRRKMFKVIKEGNYTSFPGFYGTLMRNCYTLPLSSNRATMKEFLNAVGEILAKGNFILIYPEQSMWWNYRKPKPLKKSAFKIASENSVPVLPVFITMEDTDRMGADGFPVQAYTINVGKPIYRDDDLSDAENAEKMKDENYRQWKDVYEETYKTPLKYETEKEGA
ncbi:MAG TPA: 1-acyl-sn-glycerol-3-phosphate acyltransferase [Clostridiales bacterium]|nr:1-acyl-sn-glycerol-3-phosphate acyltransferase [Clostridiales bacterium]